MEWPQIFGLGVWAALVTAATNVASTWLFGLAQRKQLAVYYATRICIELERYAYICASLISEESNYYASSGSAGSQFFELPQLVVDVDTDWKVLDMVLVHRILSFQNDIIRGQGVIIGEGNMLTPLDEPEAPAEQAGLLGYRAYLLADEFRKTYSELPPRSTLHPWDYVAVLKERHDAKVAEYNDWIRSFPHSGGG